MRIRTHMPRSERSINMFIALYTEGPLHARELQGPMGLSSSRYVYSYARYWIRLGFITVLRGIFGHLYKLGLRGVMTAKTLIAVRELREPEEGILKILLRRLHAKGLRDRLYRDVVRALYYMVKDKDNTPYVRAWSAERLARLFLVALRDRGYTEEQILEALETLAEAGVIEFNRPSGNKRKWAVAFTHGFTRGTGVPAAPVSMRRKPPG